MKSEQLEEFDRSDERWHPADKAPRGKPVKTLINGQPYKITPNSFGYGVTNTSSRANNIGRSYQVQVDKAGRPTSCSCPHHSEKRVICKHMATIARLERDKEREVASHSLEHPSKPRLYRFGVLSNGTHVRYERWEGGACTSSQVLPVQEARNRYAWLKRSGYSPFGFISRELDRKPAPGR